MALCLFGLVLGAAGLDVAPAFGQRSHTSAPPRTLSQYAPRAWTAKDGLPHSMVLSITQTQDGYLWIGTRGGLARLDGARFTVFNTRNTEALRSNDIRTLYEDPSGALWIGTLGGGLTRYQHRIEDLAVGRHAFRLKQVDFDGAFEYSPVVEVEIEAPRTLALLPNYPNPFNPRTTLAFTVPHEGRAVLTLSDVLGREVAVLFDGVAEAGRQHAVPFEAGSLATGLYVYTLQHGGQRLSRTLLLTK